MTYLEKLKSEKREYSKAKAEHISSCYCPSDFGMRDPKKENCVVTNCADCWNSEIEDTYE